MAGAWGSKKQKTVSFGGRGLFILGGGKIDEAERGNQRSSSIQHFQRGDTSMSGGIYHLQKGPMPTLEKRRNGLRGNLSG